MPVDPARPILFLDIDGVFNSAEWYQERKRLREVGMLTWPKDEPDRTQEFDPVCVARFNKILEACDPQIVFSTAWRKSFECDALQAVMEKAGVERFDCLGRTPWFEHPCQRGCEVATWLEQHKVGTWHVDRKEGWGSVTVIHRPKVPLAILDDGSDFEGLEDWFVRTSWNNGLQDRQVRRVIALLGGDL